MKTWKRFLAETEANALVNFGPEEISQMLQDPNLDPAMRNRLQNLLQRQGRTPRRPENMSQAELEKAINDPNTDPTLKRMMMMTLRKMQSDMSKRYPESPNDPRFDATLNPPRQ